MLENLLSSNGFIIVNKQLAKVLGLNSAILIGELYSEYTYWKQNGKLTEDGYFYSTRENIEQNTTLSERQQRYCLDDLKKRGLVTTKMMGIPAKLYYKFNEQAIFNLILGDNTKEQDLTKVSGLNNTEMLDLNLTKLSTNNNNKNNKDNKNNTKTKVLATPSQNVNSSKTAKTKKEKYLDMILAKLQEYDFSEKVQEKILDYYSDQIDAKNYPQEIKLNMELDMLANANETQQLQSIEAAILGGWKSMCYKLQDNQTNKQSYRLDVTDKETVEQHEQRVAELMNSENSFTF